MFKSIEAGAQQCLGNVLCKCMNTGGGRRRNSSQEASKGAEAQGCLAGSWGWEAGPAGPLPEACWFQSTGHH